MLKIKDVFNEVVTYEGVDPESLFYGACHDHRLLKKGEVFLAFQGQSCHGVDFANQALLDKNASAVVVTQPYANRFDGPKIIVEDMMVTLRHIACVCREKYPHPIVAVTGSCGKTSFKEIFASLFHPNICFKSFANWNNELGLMINLSRLRSDHRYCVFELGISEIGDMDVLVDLLRPDHVVITSLGAAHLEGLKSLETIIYEKQKIAKWASACYSSEQAFSLLNQEHWIQVGIQAGNCFMEIADSDSRVTLIESGETKLIRSLQAPFRWQPPLLGLALKVAVDVMCDPCDIVDTIHLPVAYGRGELIEVGPWRLLNETYNSNPLSLTNLVEFLESKAERSVIVFGDMLELGQYLEYYQNLIAQLLKNMKYVQAVYLGDQYQRWQGLGIAAFSFHQQEAFLEEVARHPNGVIAFKASHSVGFEYWMNVVHSFLSVRQFEKAFLADSVRQA